MSTEARCGAPPPGVEDRNSSRRESCNSCCANSPMPTATSYTSSKRSSALKPASAMPCSESARRWIDSSGSAAGDVPREGAGDVGDVPRGRRGWKECNGLAPRADGWLREAPSLRERRGGGAADGRRPGATAAADAKGL
eukprot:scaffold14860_cov62-Isochrysis_galbana.AAC.1